MEPAEPDFAAFAEAIVFLDYFKDMPDPRQRGKVMYPLQEVLLLCLLAVLAGAETFVDIARFGEKKLDLLRRFRRFPNGTPSHDHLGDILATLDATQFQRCFVTWVAAVTGAPADVIAIDGKTLRGSAKTSAKRDAKAAVHMVSAFAARQRLVLGQVKVADKSNEIVAIPQLLALLSIEGAIVTIDAMGCQRAIAAQILAQKADYVLALKGNQGSLREDVELFAAEQKANGFKDTAISRHNSVDGDHGRIETRTTTVMHDVAWLKDRHDWPGLTSVVMVESTREIGAKIEQEPASTSPRWRPRPTSSDPSSAATGRWRTACIGSWTWCSATTTAASAPITPPPISPPSSTWPSTSSARPRARIHSASSEKSPPGTTTSSQVSSPNDGFTRLPCHHGNGAMAEGVWRGERPGVFPARCGRGGSQRAGTRRRAQKR